MCGMCRESDLLMKIKTSDLTGKALNYAVAVSEGFKVHKNATLNGKLKQGFWVDGYNSGKAPWLELNWLNYCVAWSYGGPIIEREKLDIEWVTASLCRASCEWLDEDFFEGFGPTPLIAAMRCLVSKKLGPEVEIPGELL